LDEIPVLMKHRFNGIAWSQPSETYPRGVIAGALDSGALVLWDAEKLLKEERSLCAPRYTVA
jgi:protein transport protein SEC31